MKYETEEMPPLDLLHSTQKAFYYCFQWWLALTGHMISQDLVTADPASRYGGKEMVKEGSPILQKYDCA